MQTLRMHKYLAQGNRYRLYLFTQLILGSWERFEKIPHPLRRSQVTNLKQNWNTDISLAGGNDTSKCVYVCSVCMLAYTCYHIWKELTTCIVTSRRNAEVLFSLPEEFTFPDFYLGFWVWGGRLSPPPFEGVLCVCVCVCCFFVFFVEIKFYGWESTCLWREVG